MPSTYRPAPDRACVGGELDGSPAGRGGERVNRPRTRQRDHRGGEVVPSH